MRFALVACCFTIFATACFNVTSSNGPPPVVDPPVIACTLEPDAAVDASTDASTDASDAATDDASTEAGSDGGVQGYWYNTCQLPPSVCADSHWAAYFDNGTCDGHTCQLVTKYHFCATGCSFGACVSSGETAANRGF